MNSATANSSDTPSRTLMEVSPSCGDCRVATVWVGRKDGVKSGFMRGLRGVCTSNVGAGLARDSVRPDTNALI
eukprot:gene23211-27599_t